MAKRRNSRYVEVLLLFATLLGAGPGLAANRAPSSNEKARVERQENKIPNLEFDETDLEVSLDDNGPIERPYVMLNGRFKARDGSLTVTSMGNRPIKLDKGERFRFRVYLKKKRTEFKLAEVDALGQVKYESVAVNFDGWENFREDLELDFKRQFTFIPSIGFTSASYAEVVTTSTSSVSATYSGILLTPKLAINYRYAPRWTVGLNTFFSTIALKATSNVPGATMKFIGANVRMSYQLSSIRDPWNLQLGTGVYYMTTMATADDPDLALGFKNAMGPQFIANLRYRFNHRDSLLFYTKFALVGEKMALRSLSDHELAFGLGVARSFNEGKNIGSINLDWASFAIKVRGAFADQTAFEADTSNQTLSLSGAYSF